MSLNNSQFLVINTENSKIWNPITFAQMFQSSFGIENDVWKICELASGDILPDDISEFQGVVITGSHFNCRDGNELKWFQPLCDFIQQTSTIGKPRLYGGCFGCQVIAHALGGIVDCNPNSRFILKAEDVKPIYPLFSEIFQSDDDKQSFQIIVSHGDCVHKLPLGASRIANSVSCENEIFVCGINNNIIALQGHPELEYNYSIRDRIWPVVVDQRKRLSDEELEIAKCTFEKFLNGNYSDVKIINHLISKFLRVKFKE